MRTWSNDLFDKITAGSGLGPQSLEACRRVLVPHDLPNGTVGVEKRVDVAKDMGLFPSQITRATVNLQQRLVEFGNMSNEQDFQQARGAMKIEAATSRDVAIDKVRGLYPDIAVREAKFGETYIGKPLVRTPHHLVQSVGGGAAVIHDLKKLQRVPDMNFPIVEVKYPSNGDLAEVQEKQPEQVRGGRTR